MKGVRLECINEFIHERKHDLVDLWIQQVPLSTIDTFIFWKCTWRKVKLRVFG